MEELKADHRQAAEALEKARDAAQAGQREAEKEAGEAEHRAETQVESLQAEFERLPQ
ncbi:hypothetical protein HLB35_15845 [Halomonas sp. TBZ9]|uniref:Uncharacterized protein n=1 Tax=Vreelandella azerica TaxID=2732867 RepID=A0A7Y3TZ34_9GAMM|nr:hypothetical protein [Halomonas azerica]NOG32867.1 hypothetical protein [Halomonas azerica]